MYFAAKAEEMVSRTKSTDRADLIIFTGFLKQHTNTNSTLQNLPKKHRRSS